MVLEGRYVSAYRLFVFLGDGDWKANGLMITSVEIGDMRGRWSMVGLVMDLFLGAAYIGSERRSHTNTGFPLDKALKHLVLGALESLAA